MAAEVLQQLDLSQGSLGENLLAEHIGNFLDGNSLGGLVVNGSTREKQWHVNRPLASSVAHHLV